MLGCKFSFIILQKEHHQGSVQDSLVVRIDIYFYWTNCVLILGLVSLDMRPTSSRYDLERSPGFSSSNCIGNAVIADRSKNLYPEQFDQSSSIHNVTYVFLTVIWDKENTFIDFTIELDCWYRFSLFCFISKMQDK